MPKTSNSGLNKSQSKMPVLFIGHGSPMNAIEDNEFSRAWIEIGRMLPKPKVILCISAHWETNGTYVTAMENPITIHDFYGFPPMLYQQQYPAPGSPELTKLVQKTIDKTQVQLDFNWGLDHGTWSVLIRMFPLADIPVVQLSLDRTKPPAFHYELGKALNPLRDRGIMIVGSGNMVHNLGIMTWEDRVYDWAGKFDLTVKQLIETGDHESIINYEKFGKIANLAIPTNEHFLPLLYVLALKDEAESVSFFAEKVTFGSISMRCLKIG